VAHEGRVVVTFELAGYTNAFETKNDEEVARFVDDYYQLCESVLAKHGGTILKFMGDGCLATFPPEATVEAVGSALELQRAVNDLAKRYQLRLVLGANIHVAVVVDSFLSHRARAAFNALLRRSSLVIVRRRPVRVVRRCTVWAGGDEG